MNASVCTNGTTNIGTLPPIRGTHAVANSTAADGAMKARSSRRKRLRWALLALKSFLGGLHAIGERGSAG